MKAIKFLLALVVVVAVIYGAWQRLPLEFGQMSLEGLALFAGYSLAVVVGFFVSVAFITKLLGLQSINRFVVKSFVWLIAAFAFVCMLGIGATVVLGVREDGFIAIPIVFGVLLGGGLGGYIGYIILTFLVGFLGHEFEKLGNALPSGRSVLFAEALNAGYNKPQTRAFIAELSQNSGPEMGAGGVYTTLILYVIPALISIAILCDVIYGFL